MKAAIAGYLAFAALALSSGMPGSVAADMPFIAKQAVTIDPARNESRDQLYPEVAHGAGTFLVTWQLGQNYYMGPTADILAARLDDSGMLLDTKPIVVCSRTGSQERPQAAYSGSQFLVIWQDFRNGRDWDVYGARITRSGEVLDENGFLIAGGQGNQALPVVAPAPEGFLVIWQDTSASSFYELHASMVNKDGTTSPSWPLVYRGRPKPELWGYTPGWGYSRSPIEPQRSDNYSLTGGEAAIVRIGAGWLLSWNDETNWMAGGKGHITRRFARLSRSGKRVHVTSLHPSPALALGSQAGTFTSNGDDLVLYTGWPHISRGRSFGAALFLSGETAEPVLDAATEAIRKQKLPGWNTGGAFLVFDRPLEPSGPIAAGFGQGVFLVSSVIQLDSRNKQQVNRIIGFRFDAEGRPLDNPEHGLLLVESSRQLLNAALAGSGTGFLLAYQHEDDQGRQRIELKPLPPR